MSYMKNSEYICGKCKVAKDVDWGKDDVPVLFSQAGTKISPYSKFGVGKKVGGAIMLHRDEARQLGLLKDFKEIPKEYNVVKLYEKKGGKYYKIDFITSPDFDTADEPLLTDRVRYDERTGKTEKGQDLQDPYVLHHKWLLVKPDYKGFNYQASVNRSKKILDIGYPFNRVERKSLWDEWKSRHTGV